MEAKNDSGQLNERLQKRRLKRRTRFLHSLVVIALLVIVAVPVWRFYLAMQLKDVIVSFAETYINGKVDFGSITVNPFTGAVRVNSVRIYLDDSSLPVVEIPTATMDAFALKNKVIDLSLRFPTIRVVRDNNGEINIKRLLKESEETKEKGRYDIQIDFTGMTVFYRDLLGLPPRTLAQIRAGNAVVGKFEQYVASLGVKPVAKYDPNTFEFETVLDRIGGYFNLQAATRQAKGTMKGVFDDDDFELTGDYELESGKVNATFSTTEIDYRFVAPVVNQITPFAEALTPSATLDKLNVFIAGSTKETIGARIEADFTDIGLVLPKYPEFGINSLALVFDSGTGQLEIKNLNAIYADALLSLSGLIETKEKSLDLKVKVVSFDIASAPVKMPVNGVMSAELAVAGGFDSPVIEGWAGMSEIVWQGHSFGSADVSFKTAGNSVNIDRFSMGGGEISIAGSGVVSKDLSMDIDFSLSPTPIPRLAQFSDSKVPASGNVGANGRFRRDSLGRINISGNAYSPSLTASERKIESVRADFQYDGRILSARNVAFRYKASPDVEVRALANIETTGIEGGNPRFKIAGHASLIGLPRLETEAGQAPKTDLIGLIPTNPEGDVLFVDPNAPQKGVVILSTDPSRIGMEVWWPRQPVNEPDENTENGESGTSENNEPQAPDLNWLNQAQLSRAMDFLVFPVENTPAIVVDGELYPYVEFDTVVEMTGKSKFSTKGNLTIDNLLNRPITVEIKGEGSSSASKFYIDAEGKYKTRGFSARAGYEYLKNSPHKFETHLLYGNSDFTFSGIVDTKKNEIKADVKSEAIQLEDLLDVQGFYGSATLDAKVNGSVTSPVATGELKLDSAEYEINKPPYPVIALESGSFPFSVDKNAVNIKNGKFSFGENLLVLDGKAGSDGMHMTLQGEEFTLKTLTDLIAPNVRIDGKGTLTLRGTGDIHNPSYSMSYMQESGAVNDIPFNSAELLAQGDLSAIRVPKLHIGSDGGSINATGDLSLAETHTMKAKIDIERFQAGLITPLFMSQTDATLVGTLDGSVELSGNISEPLSSVTLALKEGNILDQDIEADLQFSTNQKEIVLDYFEAYAGESTIQANGVIRENIADSELNIEIPSLDLSLLNPFTGYSSADGFRGNISVTTFVKSGDRGTYMSGSVNGSEGLGFGIVDLQEVSGAFEIYPDLLRFKQLVLSAADSALVVDGDVPITVLGEGLQETIRSGKFTDIAAGLEADRLRQNQTGTSSDDIPQYNLNFKSENFSLAYLKTLAPKTPLEIGGSFSADITVGGQAEHPIVNGVLSLAARDIRYLDQMSIGSIDGNIHMAYDPELVSHKFTLGNFRISDPETSGEVEKKDYNKTDSTDTSIEAHTIEIGGGGTFRLMPFTIYTLDISALLSNFRNFRLLELYHGPIEGELFIEKEIDDENIHIGGEVTLEKGGVITLKTPDTKTPRSTTPLPVTIGTRTITNGSNDAVVETREVAGISVPTLHPRRESILQPFRVYVNEGVNVRFPPIVDLRAEIQGVKDAEGKIIPLKIKGDLSDISIEGKLQSDNGSLIVHRHTFRVVEPPFEIRFEPKWGVIPYIKGKAAVVIPGGANTGEADDLFGMGSFDDDLTVYVSLDALATELTEVRLTSDPPLSEDEIKRRMLGVLPPEGSVQGLTPELRDELYNLVGARVSRILEDKLNIEQFSLRIGEENELYIDIEKYITDDLSVLYSASFFGNQDAGESSQFGLRYKFLKKLFMQGYIEGFYTDDESEMVGNEIRIVLRRKF